MGCERVNEWSRSETHGNYGEMRKSMSHIMWEILLGLGHGFRLATGRCLSRHSPSFLLNGLTIWPTSFVSPAWLGMAQNHRELRATMDIWRIMRCVLKTAIPMSDGPRLVFSDCWCAATLRSSNLKETSKGNIRDVCVIFSVTAMICMDRLIGDGSNPIKKPCDTTGELTCTKKL